MWKLFDVFVNGFCFAQFDCVKTKTMSFVVDWTGGAQLRSWTWFQVNNYITIWLTWWHFLNSLFNFWKQTIKVLIIGSVSLKVICWKQNAMKLVRCVCDCVWIYFALHSLKLLNIHRSFVGWTGIELSIPTTSVVLRTASASAPSCRRKPQRPRLDAAAPGGGQRPRRGCRAPFVERRRGGRQGEQGPGASIREACASHRVSNLGHFKIFFRAWRNQVSPTWGTSRIFLGWKFCVAALLAENWWSSYSLFDFLDDTAFERLFDLWTKTIL